MRLAELIDGPAPEVEVSGLAYASKRVERGALFFCVEGFSADGHDFAADAVARGAVALVCRRPLELGVPEVLVDDVRSAMGPAASRFFGGPSRELQVCGVTGTNGKTTTAWLVRHALERAGIATGLLGTIRSVVGGEEASAVRTTPEAIDLQETFRRMLDAGDRACSMEVSSHALALGRTDGTEFACRVFTNLTPEHLDFHPSMEDYYLAKRSLFTGPGASIVNRDDEYGARLAGELGEVTTFGLAEGADFRAIDISFDWSGSRFTCLHPGGAVGVETGLPGAFNVMNAIAAIAALDELGVGVEQAAAALAGAERVPGRLEPVDAGQDFGVLVDYAHTPDSLENVLRAARELTGRRLVVVFGAGGDRDRQKRPAMGEVAERLADGVIVTSDNPRSEDPESIVAAVAAGAGSSAVVEVDRRTAITRAIEAGVAGDVVVIAGKGHEQGQEFAGGRTEPFDDREVAVEALRAAGARVAR